MLDMQMCKGSRGDISNDSICLKTFVLVFVYSPIASADQIQTLRCSFDASLSHVSLKYTP